MAPDLWPLHFHLVLISVLLISILPTFVGPENANKGGEAGSLQTWCIPREIGRKKSCGPAVQIGFPPG